MHNSSKFRDQRGNNQEKVQPIKTQNETFCRDKLIVIVIIMQLKYHSFIFQYKKKLEG